MKYWYFLFAGILNEAKDYKKLYSSVLLPVQSDEKPEERLRKELKEYGVTLTEIEDSFEFVATDYDQEDEDNQVWFDWFEDVKSSNEAKFTEWQRYR